jgi:hypothetical protein
MQNHAQWACRLSLRHFAVRGHGIDGVRQDLREFRGQLLCRQSGFRGEFGDGLLAKGVMNLGG